MDECELVKRVCKWGPPSLSPGMAGEFMAEEQIQEIIYRILHTSVCCYRFSFRNFACKNKYTFRDAPRLEPCLVPLQNFMNSYIPYEA